MDINKNYEKIRKEIPDYVKIVLAVKGRTLEEIHKVINAGATDFGQNYVQEAEIIHNYFGKKAKKIKWHMIGNIQKNKINRTIRIFDIIQTIDSLKTAEEINKRLKKLNKILPVYIEINIANEPEKIGVKPDYEGIRKLAEKILEMKYLNLQGLMTIGPYLKNEEDLRPYFRKMKYFFDKLKIDFPNAPIKTLSMGMSDSYKIAIDEGSNMIRLGTIIFGERKF